MARDPNGNITGTSGNDLLWGTARVLGDGTYDNHVDSDSAFYKGAIRGYGGNDTIFGDIYQDPTETTEGDVAYGGDGDDRIFGDTGFDEPNWQYNTHGGSDTLYGGNGADQIYGQGGHDQLYGDAGNDLLVGGTGSDTLHGGSGNDILWADIKGKTYAAQAMNHLYGGTGNDSLYGGEGIDELYGDAGSDILRGGGGGDDMAGGDGSDMLYGGAGDDILDGADLGAQADAKDHLYGEAGNDRMTGGAGNDYLFGGSGNDSMEGGVGNDYMNGGTGADTFDCGAGNDIYIIDNTKDAFRFEFADSGTDTINSSVTWRLGDFHENLTLTGTGAISGVGNDVGNIMRGNDAANTLSGKGGNDFISAGAGDDKIYGGMGADDLYGGAGKDAFIFRSIKESTLASRDTIFDFVRGDRIDLSVIDANTKVAGNQAFTFVANEGGFTGKAGQLIYDKKASDTYIYGDVNGDKKVDFSIHLDDDLTLLKGDFIL
ncbi:MAG: calcium-binding protein [Shinella sp.]|uniref:calcium-binding protein n=1 Tax=Shinella sp. TaxID=1870904 RepID=UPI004036E9EC